MFFDDAKKAATTIIGRRKPSGEKVMEAPMKAETVMNEDGEVDGRHLAAQEMLGAFHEKSPMKLMDALSNFIDLHRSHKDAESVDGKGDA